tara:strand:- start:240 stop:719 length:480 start_codon:yes stop_codon:yes gene_type:complete
MEVEEWAAHCLAEAMPECSTFSLRLSTVPMEHWFYHRNKLTDSALALDLVVPEHGLWCVTLEPRDRLFQVQWRPGGNLTVESQQLKYRRLMPWPTLDRLMDFPDLIVGIEDALGVRFLRHADIGARLLDAEALVNDDKLKAWLQPCCDTMNFARRGPGE